LGAPLEEEELKELRASGGLETVACQGKEGEKGRRWKTWAGAFSFSVPFFRPPSRTAAPCRRNWEEAGHGAGGDLIPPDVLLYSNVRYGSRFCQGLKSDEKPLSLRQILFREEGQRRRNGGNEEEKKNLKAQSC